MRSSLKKAVKQSQNHLRQVDHQIINKWRLRPLTEADSYDLLENYEVYSKIGTLIIYTLYDTDDWYGGINYYRPKDKIVHSTKAFLI